MAMPLVGVHRCGLGSRRRGIGFDGFDQRHVDIEVERGVCGDIGAWVAPLAVGQVARDHKLAVIPHREPFHTDAPPGDGTGARWVGEGEGLIASVARIEPVAIDCVSIVMNMELIPLGGHGPVVASEIEDHHAVVSAGDLCVWLGAFKGDDRVGF